MSDFHEGVPAAGLTARRVDVIVATGGNNVTLFVKELTESIPIVIHRWVHRVEILGSF
jgi:hypothetical protein